MARSFWFSTKGKAMRRRGTTKRARARILSNMDERGRYKGGRARLTSWHPSVGRYRGKGARNRYFGWLRRRRRA